MEYTHKLKPFPHQEEEFLNSRDLSTHAILWEQGTGKSKLIIDTACWQFMHGVIDCVVVVAPNGVHRNWIEQEIFEHIPDNVRKNSYALAYVGARSKTQKHKRAVELLLNNDGLSWFAIGYEAWNTKNGKAALLQLFNRRKVFLVLDESHSIKNPDSKRSKSIIMASDYATTRRILSGTPISVGPFDLYSQMLFLDSQFWVKHKLPTFVEFKKHFGIFGQIWNPKAWNPNTHRRDGNTVDVLRGYRRLPELTEMIKPICSRVEKMAVLDLIPKKYRTVYFDLSDEQEQRYRDIKEDFVTWINEETQVTTQEALAICSTCGGSGELEEAGFFYNCTECNSGEFKAGVDQTGEAIFADMAITRLLRLQQITCGYLPTDNESDPLYRIGGSNPRMGCLLYEIKKHTGKIIIWARFKEDINQIMAAVANMGISAVRYDGQVSEGDRARAKALFRGIEPVYDGAVVVGKRSIPESEQARIFVANPAAGATGLTLTEATLSIYYSNSFKLIERLQSEDRNHRIGQDAQVEYVDIVATATVDEKIIESLREKHQISAEILGDKFKDWI